MAATSSRGRWLAKKKGGKKKKEALTSLIHAGANEVFDCHPVPPNESVPLTLNASMERLRALPNRNLSVRQAH